jgi:hypothetical protein
MRLGWADVGSAALVFGCALYGCVGEAVHLCVEARGEADEGNGEGGSAGFAESESEVEQRFEAELSQEVLVGGFGGAVPGDQVVA